METGLARMLDVARGTDLWVKRNVEIYVEACMVCLNEVDDMPGSEELRKKLREKPLNHLKFLFAICGRNAQQSRLKNIAEAASYIDMQRRVCLALAPHYLDYFVLFVEWERRPEERFYAPRRKVLKRMFDAYQKLYDDELDELHCSMPPRVGKTAMVSFCLAFRMLKDPIRSNLYSSYSDQAVTTMYKAVLAILTDKKTYNWMEVFPERSVVSKNSANKTIDIDTVKGYPSATFRSLSGSLNGTCDCSGMIVGDDLISGAEAARSPQQLSTAWELVVNNFLTRAKENAKAVFNGTRWALRDPMGIRQALIRENPDFRHRRIEIINMPALNEKDESNFEYAFGVGFSTIKFKEVRAGMQNTGQMANWMAQFMGQPIELYNALFTPESMKFYNGELPATGLKRVVMAIDPAFGGGDYTAGPVAFEYENETYIHDVIFNDRDKTITIPVLANLIERYDVNYLQLELTKSTMSYKDELERVLEQRGVVLTIATKSASSRTSKEDRIRNRAPEIRSYWFLEPSARQGKPEYGAFMQNLFSFQYDGKNAHDDAPDAMSQYAEIRRAKPAEARWGRRNW